MYYAFQSTSFNILQNAIYQVLINECEISQKEDFRTYFEHALSFSKKK